MPTIVRAMPRLSCPARAGVSDGTGEPNWQPLLDAVGEHLTGTFMWMYRVHLDGGGILHAYKHIFTRRYMHLGEDGRVYEYTACGRYVVSRLDFAIEAALFSWLVVDGGLEDEDVAQIRAAYFRSHERAA